jgi:hypothetical protein
MKLLSHFNSQFEIFEILSELEKIPMLNLPSRTHLRSTVGLKLQCVTGIISFFLWSRNCNLLSLNPCLDHENLCAFRSLWR